MSASVKPIGWIHIPQSFCGRLGPDTPPHIKGICTFSFTTCHIVVIVYRHNENVYASLIHLDSGNHPDLIEEELNHYQQHYKNGSYEIFIFKQEKWATDSVTNHMLRNVKKNKNIKYNIIVLPIQQRTLGIAIPFNYNNFNVNLSSIQKINDEESKKWIPSKPDTFTKDLGVIRHPFEWKIILINKILLRIENLKIQNTFKPYLIFNGIHWVKIKNQKLPIYPSLIKFLESFKYESSIHDITEKLYEIFYKIKKTQKDISIDYQDEREYLIKGALCSKILKGINKYDGGVVLKNIIDENCQYIINLFDGINLNPKLHALDINNIPDEEKISVITYCKKLMNTKCIHDINAIETLKTLARYEGFSQFFVLLRGHLPRYIYTIDAKWINDTKKEFGDLALMHYKKNDFETAKKCYWQTVIYSRYIYAVPSNEMAKSYYNYGAASQNAHCTDNAELNLQYAYYMNQHLLKSDGKNKEFIARKNKTLRRLKQLGVDHLS